MRDKVPENSGRLGLKVHVSAEQHMYTCICNSEGHIAMYILLSCIFKQCNETILRQNVAGSLHVHVHTHELLHT